MSPESPKRDPRKPQEGSKRAPERPREGPEKSPDHLETVLERRLRVARRPLGVFLEPPWGPLGAILGPPWALPDCFEKGPQKTPWGPREGSEKSPGHPETVLERLWVAWSCLEALLEPSCGLLLPGPMAPCSGLPLRGPRQSPFRGPGGALVKGSRAVPVKDFWFSGSLDEFP